MAEFLAPSPAQDQPVAATFPPFENEEEQLQELEVLESIYGIDFCLKERTAEGFYCFQVACKVLLEEGGQSVELQPHLLSKKEEGGHRLTTGSSAEEKEGAGDATSTSHTMEDPPDSNPKLLNSLSGRPMERFTVKNLPPLVLDVVFPKEYPVQEPPQFTLRAEWLSSVASASLGQELLEEVWVQQHAGGPVVFAWVDHLTERAVGAAQAADATNGGGGGGGGDGGEENGGALRLEGTSLEEIQERLLGILEYNNRAEQQSFIQSEHLCGVCFVEKTGDQFFRLQRCKHHFCAECFEGYVGIHVAEGQTHKLVCPEPKCGESLPPDLIRAVVSEEEYTRWERLALQKGLDAMADLTYCPRCQTATIADNALLARCPQCEYCFCGRCRCAYHPGEPCNESMEADALKKNLLELSRKEMDSQQKARKAKQLREELENIKALNKECRQCPKCSMFIYKSGGCNKMTCSNCGTYMCWLCSREIEGYDHFGESRCGVFAEAEIQDWNRQMQQRMDLYRAGQEDAFIVPIDHWGRVGGNRHRAAAPVPGWHGHPCPFCKYRNYKTQRNNHINCHNCRQHYCFMCREKVKKSTEHFGPGKPCKQHS